MMLVLLRQNFDDVFLGGGFNFFQFSALPGEMIQFD